MVTLDIRDERLLEIVSPETPLERHLSGFKFTEGPIWNPVDGHLRFSDITGNSIYQWSERDGLADIRPNSHLANGNTYDRQGRMLTCHHASSRVTRTEPDGSITVIASHYEGRQLNQAWLRQYAAREGVIASHYEGRQLNSPNDIVVKSDGAIYFTDPMSGREPFVGIPRESEMGFAGVYRVEPESGALVLLVDDFVKPNGLCFSLDETRLYINDTARFHIRAFEVRADGTLTNGRVWAETTGEGVGVPDGMKIDRAGNLFCCGQGGIHVYAADAACLGRILLPEHTTNFIWGDADLMSLYITASTSVYRLRLKVAGVPLFGG